MAVHCLSLIFTCRISVLDQAQIVNFSYLVVWVDLFSQLQLFGQFKFMGLAQVVRLLNHRSYFLCIFFNGVFMNGLKGNEMGVLRVSQ